MTKNKQISKNIELSEKLANYLASHPIESEALPNNASFVAFSKDDERLNEENIKLIRGLIEEGKNVIKALQTNDKNNPWIFSAIA